MSPRLLRLHDSLERILGIKPVERLGELTLEVKAAEYRDIAQKLRDHPDLRFEQVTDLCGVDYSTYGDRPAGSEHGAGPGGASFAAVLHLLSFTHNWRLRLRCFCPDNAFPVLPSVIEVWPSVNWYEREAFDLFGIVFDGHPDLRRILTDYGFIGHPFRKDFPISGHVEMRYDPEQKRVVYQPVSIEPREVTPRVVRESHYAEDK
jgi:NADH-quinone oxidoreductase subunit C